VLVLVLVLDLRRASIVDERLTRIEHEHEHGERCDQARLVRKE